MSAALAPPSSSVAALHAALAVKKIARAYTPEEEALLALFTKLESLPASSLPLSSSSRTKSPHSGGSVFSSSSPSITPSSYAPVSASPSLAQTPAAGPAHAAAPAVLSAKEAADKLQALKAQAGSAGDAPSTFKRPTLMIKRHSSQEESAAKRVREVSSYNPALAREQMKASFVRQGERRDLRPMHTVFVGGLNNPVTLYQLRDHFSPCGRIINVKLISGKNFGFVNFYDAESIPEALKLSGTSLEGNYLRVSKALPRKPMEQTATPAPAPMLVGSDAFFPTESRSSSSSTPHAAATPVDSAPAPPADSGEFD